MARTTQTVLAGLNLPARDAYDLPTSGKRFGDGGQYRIEIPSVEGPRALEAVLEAGQALRVPIHRVSQGSGIMLQTDDEIERMLALGRARGVEVCLFVGPRANWDTGAQAASASGRVPRCAAPTSSYTGSRTYGTPAVSACVRFWSPTSGSSWSSER